jgi:hypothetical protein
MHVAEHIYQGYSIEKNCQQQAHPFPHLTWNKCQNSTNKIKIEEKLGSGKFVGLSPFDVKADLRLRAEIAQCKHKDEEGPIHT